MGGKKQESRYTPPSYVEGGARQAVDLGRRIGNQTYTPYTAQRVAPLSQNEQLGMSLARNTGAAMPYFQEGASLMRRGAERFTDADMQGYMNPYIKGVLDPSAREISERGAREANRLDSMRPSMDAFGGSRGALLRGENYEKTNQAISDLYSGGYGDAWNNAVSIWGADRAAAMAAGGQLVGVGQAVQNAQTMDVSTLMATGATDRNIKQALRDFDYQQFIENRDWDLRNLQGLLTALQGVQGSVSTTQTTEQDSDPFGVMLGIAATVMGGMMNPAGAAASVASGVGGAMNGEMVGGGLVA